MLAISNAKRILIFCPFVFLWVKGQGQRTEESTIIVKIKLSKINEETKVQFSSTQTKIRVECKDEAEAQTNKDLKINVKPSADPGIEGVLVDAKPDDNFLLFELKDKLTEDNHEFAFFKANKVLGKIKLQRFTENNQKIASGTVIKYKPKLPPESFDILSNLPNSISKLDNKSYKEVSPTKTNFLVYSFCGDDHSLLYKHNNNKKFRPLVGSRLSIQLNPVPNPLRYDITITSKYNSYGMDADPLLEQLLLNPNKYLNKAHSGGSEGIVPAEEIRRKEAILGYLYKINAQITTFIDAYEKLDCIDAKSFTERKNKIENNINDQLSRAPGLNYLGNYIDFVKIEFDVSDSSYVKPLVQNYLKFKNIHVSPFYYQIPKLKNADELSLNLKILPKEKSNAAMKVDSMDIDLPIFGGFKIDVSPGLFYSFYNSNLYSLRSDSTVIKGTNGSDSVVNLFKTIVKESENKNDMGFSSLLHFYSRWGRDVNIAASIGAGITLNDKPEVRYFTGISLLIGRINRLALSAGRSFGKVEEISDRYFEGDDRKNAYRKVNMQETVLQTNKVLKSGWFASVSYNIPLIKRTAKPEGSKPSDNEEQPEKKTGGEQTTPPKDSNNDKQNEKNNK